MLGIEGGKLEGVNFVPNMCEDIYEYSVAESD
jgi:hypothetical protein